MAMVLIRCSESNLPVATGLFMKPSEFETADLSESERRLRCPDCGGEHVWRKEDAHLLDEEQPVPAQE